MKKRVLLSAIFMSLTYMLTAQVIHVPGERATIQGGIDAAGNGDTVLVDQGIYYENIDFKGKAITLSSHYIHTLDSTDIDSTIIDGSQPQYPNQASVVRISGPDTNAVICGFTIQNGTGTQVTNRGGGGVVCLNGGKIIHNRIINNSVLAADEEDALGGGIWAEGNSNSHFVIRNNIIENNQMENTNSSNGCWGTGIGFYYGNILVENNIIRHNSATGQPYGVGIYCAFTSGVIRENSITNNTGHHTLANRSRGGGMYLVNNYSDLIISSNEISHNQLIQEIRGTKYGGGIGLYNTGGFENERILIENNIIADNSANRGGGISFTEIYNVRLSNNVIRNNTAEYTGGGIYFENYGKKGGDIAPECHEVTKYSSAKSGADSIPVLVNNTIAGNNADYGGGIIGGMESDYLLFNNIMYDDSSANEGNEIYLYSGSNAFLYYNNIDTIEISGNGTWEGENNAAVDPCFDVDGFHLMEESQCINGGADSVKVNSTVYFAPLFDIDNDARPYDDYLDIGADEFVGVFPGVDELSAHTITFHMLCFPNPFLSKTTIGYELQHSSDIQLSLSNQKGEIVKFLISEHQSAGKHQLTIDLGALDAGIYFCTLKTGEGTQTTKIIKL